jgi:hypothetical protein
MFKNVSGGLRMSDDVKAIVQWLRERARKAQHNANVGEWVWNSRGTKEQPAHSAEADYAGKFADEIEHLFGRENPLDGLRSKAVPIEGVTIVPPSARDLRRRRKRR